MKITSAEFVISAVNRSQYPKDGLPQVALVGRSNVGKSSLINKFVNRKGLAKTSSQPGKTQTINFYRINGEFYLVDFPGFGYASVPMALKKTWEKMMDDYFDDRPELKGVIVVLDLRREVGGYEEGLYGWLDRLGLKGVTVFTKSDKLSKNEMTSRAARLKKAFGLKDLVFFSSLTGDGKIELGKKIRHLIGPGPGGTQGGQLGDGTGI